MTREQVDTLWKALICESSTEKLRNYTYHWFEQGVAQPSWRQALSDTCEHIFMDLVCRQDLSTLSDMGFAMFRTYLKFLNFTMAPEQGSQRRSCSEVKGMPQLWHIAVHAESEHVAAQAIAFVNQVYQHLAQQEVGRMVERREEYIANCMKHLLEVTYAPSAPLLSALNLLCWPIFRALVHTNTNTDHDLHACMSRRLMQRRTVHQPSFPSTKSACFGV